VLEKQGGPTFWEMLYHYKGVGGSGVTPTISGIINDLFPFDHKGNFSEYRAGDSRKSGHFPIIVGTVPFVWDYMGKKIKCEFKAGNTVCGYSRKYNHVYAKSTWVITRKTERADRKKDVTHNIHPSLIPDPNVNSNWKYL